MSTNDVRYSRAYYYRKRGLVADPPAGYIRLSDAAKRLHYTRAGLLYRISQGWMADHLWRRAPRSPWYIHESALTDAT